LKPSTPKQAAHITLFLTEVNNLFQNFFEAAEDENITWSTSF
tara:strand:+ start:597 stop:722 length:126 start_codon:yes stop_codon:yes gene_type:complete